MPKIPTIPVGQKNLPSENRTGLCIWCSMTLFLLSMTAHLYHQNGTIEKKAPLDQNTPPPFSLVPSGYKVITSESYQENQAREEISSIPCSHQPMPSITAFSNSIKQQMLNEIKSSRISKNDSYTVENCDHGIFYLLKVLCH